MRQVAALALLPACAITWAQAQPPSSPAADWLRLARFAIHGFAIEGNSLVPNEVLLARLARFVGGDRGNEDVAAARAAVLEAYREAGYEMVSVERQPSLAGDGIFRFRVDEVRIANVRVTGLAALTEERVRSQLPELREGATPRLEPLGRQLALFNDNPGRSATLEYSRAAPGTVDVEVKVAEAPQSRSQLVWTNTGTVQTGRSRASASWSHHEAFSAGHQATLAASTSPEFPRKVMQLSASYLVPLPSLGDAISVGASYSKVTVGRVSDLFNIAGSSASWNARYVRNLVRTEAERRSLEVGYDERRYRDIVDFFGVNLGTSVTARPASLAYRYQRAGAGRSAGFSLVVQRNVPGGMRNDDATYAASRAGARAAWSNLQFEASCAEGLAGGWVIIARAAGQQASAPLVAAEQFGLGGANAVRGLPEREAAGDRGLRAHLELASPRFGGGHQAVGFVDAGRSRRLNAQPSEVTGEGVASYGIGWRFARGPDLQFVIDAARVVDGTPRTGRGATRIHGTAVLRF